MPEKILSIFVDESGDFGEPSTHSPFYFFVLVFHNQADDIGENVARFNERLAFDGYPNHAIHTGCLIRREKDYKDVSMSERQTLFKRIYYFARKLPIKYKAFVFVKREYPSTLDFITSMAKQLSEFIKSNSELFETYDRVVLYYDNGQHELNKVLNIAFASFLLFCNIEYRIVMPVEYRLFQVADMICTLELMRTKLANSMMSSSEKQFFDTKELKKTYIAGIDKFKM